MKKYSNMTHEDKIEFLIEVYIEDNKLDDIDWEIIEEGKKKYLYIEKTSLNSNVKEGVVCKILSQIPTESISEDYNKFSELIDSSFKDRLEEIESIKQIISDLNSSYERDEDE